MGHLVGTAAPLTGFLTDSEAATRAQMGETAWWYWFGRGWFSGVDGEA